MHDIPPNLTPCFAHFQQRVRERIGPDVDAVKLWHIIIAQIEDGPSEYLTFLHRITRDGRSAWRFEIKRREFILIFDREANCPITVLPGDAVVVRREKPKRRHKRKRRHYRPGRPGNSEDWN